jgi:ribonuclease HI
MLITMFTDASYNDKIQVGTWACWAKAQGETYRYCGVLRGTIGNVNESELAAVANGLAKLHKDRVIVERSRLIIQSDSKTALNAISKRHYHTPYGASVITFIDDMHKRLSLSFDLRHIKAHSGRATSRAAVNRWCDLQCRRLMRSLVRGEITAPPPRGAQQAPQQELDL